MKPLAPTLARSEPFDDEERDLMDIWDEALEDPNLDIDISPAQMSENKWAAQNTINPPKQKISTRLAKPDLAKLKARAMEKGMPYQTLLASIIHQYVEGTLVERQR